MDVVYQEFKGPLELQVELTSACNHKCIHCYNYWREESAPVAIMQRQNMQQILENAAKCEVQEIVFTGGEPLLCPDLLFEAIDLAQKAKIKCALNSNLTLLNEKTAAELKRRSIGVLTSFPSYDPATFEKIVNRQGAFEKTLNGIKLALLNGIRVTANMVAMKQNVYQILQTGRFLYSVGVRTFTATRVHASLSCKDFSAMQLSPDELLSVFDSLLTLRDELGINVDTLTCYPLCFFKDMDRYGDLLMKRSCCAGKTAGAVSVDGSVRSCTHADESFGNAIYESFFDIWPRMKKWRDGSLIPAVCRECKWVQTCGAGCRMDSKYFHKTEDMPDTYMIEENIEKVTMNKTERKLPLLDFDTTLYVNPHSSYREESFGTFINSGYGRRIVTKDTCMLLKKLEGKPFCVNDVLQKYDTNLDDVKEFFAALLLDGIILTQEEYDNLQVSQH